MRWLKTFLTGTFIYHVIFDHVNASSAALEAMISFCCTGISSQTTSKTSLLNTTNTQCTHLPLLVPLSARLFAACLLVTSFYRAVSRLRKSQRRLTTSPRDHITTCRSRCTIAASLSLFLTSSFFVCHEFFLRVYI